MGQQPASIAVDQSAHLVYVANAGSDSLSVLDGVALRVLTTRPLPLTPRAVAVDAATHEVYVAGQIPGSGAGVLWLYTREADIGVANFPLGATPTGLAEDPASRTLYITESVGASGGVLQVARLAAARDTVAGATVWITRSGTTGSPALDRAARTLYLAVGEERPEDGELAGIATATIGADRSADRMTLKPAQLPGIYGGPGSVAVDAQTGRVLLTAGHQTLLILTGDALTTGPKSVRVGPEPYGVAVDPSTSTVYVTNYAANSVSVVDESTGAVVAMVPVGVNPEAVAVDATTHRVYVGNFSSNTVTVLDGIRHGKLGAPPVPALPGTGGGGAARLRNLNTDQGNG